MHNLASTTAKIETVASLEDVTFVYENGTVALDHISLSIEAGKRTCIIGANGSGKSTLASLLSGLSAPDSGSVTLVGEKVFVAGTPNFQAYEQARRQLGLVFQNPKDQIVTSIVDEDIAFGPENLQVPSNEISRRVARELKRVALLDRAHADPATLSGGQQQRVAIAGALAMNPKLLILDEPSASLDVIGRRGVMKLVDTLCGEGRTVVHITHFMEEVIGADRVVVLSHGRIAFDGTPTDFFAREALVASLNLREPFEVKLVNILRAHNIALPWTISADELFQNLCTLLGQVSAHSKIDASKRDEDGFDLTKSQPSTTDTKNPIVHVEDVSYAYTQAALTDVSFEILAGTTTALIGATGSGKSTLARLLCALEVPDSGRITVDGIPTDSKKNRRLLHGIIGYVMQHPERQLFAQTVFEDVAFGPTNLKLSKEDIKERVEETLELVGLSHKAQTSPFELSGGQQRLCALAGVLAMRPRILILDEPTAGLDPHGRAHLQSVLDAVRKNGTTIVEITHSMDYAALADQVIVLHKAHLIATGTPREVFSSLGEKELLSLGLGLPRPLLWSKRIREKTGIDLGQPLSLHELASALLRQLKNQQLRGETHGA